MLAHYSHADCFLWRRAHTQKRRDGEREGEVHTWIITEKEGDQKIGNATPRSAAWLFSINYAPNQAHRREPIFNRLQRCWVAHFLHRTHCVTCGLSHSAMQVWLIGVAWIFASRHRRLWSVNHIPGWMKANRCVWVSVEFIDLREAFHVLGTREWIRFCSEILNTSGLISTWACLTFDQTWR